jgi:hypothetical protein
MQKRRRELEVSIDRVRQVLQERKRRWRRLHHESQTLKHRISAPHQTILLSEQAPTPQRSPLQAARLAGSAIQTDPVGAVKENTQAPVPSRGYWDVRKEPESKAQHQMVKGSRRSTYHQHCAAPSRKAISAFKHHATVSFSILGKYMTSQKLRSSSQCGHQELRRAFLMYQNETAQRLKVPASRICWYLEWPYEVCAHRRLCTSFSAWSGACQLTSMVAQIVMSLESLFLVMEHEHLKNAADPLFKPPKHPILETRAPPHPTRPQLPEPMELATAYLRCSVTDLLQMPVAMRTIFQPLVRQSRCFLPEGKWLTICLQMLHIAQLTVESLRSTTRQKSQASGTHSTEASTNQGAECSFEVRGSISPLFAQLAPWHVGSA